MKSIKIPEPVVLMDNDKPVLDADKRPVIFTFEQFVKNSLLIDAKFGKTMADVLTAVEIKTKLTGAQETLELENSDYEKLLAVLQEPSSPYNPVLAVQVVSFFLAIKNAK